MASPRPPPPLPLIKEKTRTLQQKIKRRAAQTTLNTSSSTLSDQSQTSFTVVHSTEAAITPAAAVITPSALTSTPLVSVDTAIARLHTYRDEQLLLHSAVEHCERRTLLTTVRHWRHATHSQSHLHLLRLATQLSQQHSVRRLRTVVRWWTRAAKESRQYNQRHGHLIHFYGRHLQRITFVGWVAHTLHRKDKEVDALLAQSLSRSSTLRAVWRQWQQTAAIATHQRVLEQRAQQHADVQLTELSLLIWRSQGSKAVKQRQAERSAALLGDTRSKRHYLQRWRQLPATVRQDEEAAPQLVQRTHQQLQREAWQAWRKESEWRQAAQLASDALVRWRQQWMVKAAWDGWEGIAEDETVDEQRARQADEWHSRQHVRSAVQWWRGSNRDAKAERVRGSRLQSSVRQSLQYWRVWAHQQRLMQAAQRHHEYSSAVQTLRWWRQQLQLSGSDRQMRERARTHEYESRMISALRQWQRNASYERQSRECTAVATAYQRSRLLRNGLSGFTAHCQQRHTERQHASFVRRHQLLSAVALLHQHALYQRHCWQLHLRAKRFRYFHLLRHGWYGWQEVRHAEAAAEERLFAERCGGLVLDWTRHLFGAWLRLTSEQRVAREREVEALTQWRGRLVVEAWQEWQIAVLDRMDEQQRFRIADNCLHRNSQRDALTNWLSYTRFKQQLRQAESETVEVGRQQLHLLARRRVWQQFQLAFHTSRAHRFDLNKAHQHHTSRRLQQCLHTWHHYSSTSAQRNQLQSVAAAAHGRRLLSLAWQRWLAIQAERRRLLALHVRAMEWRTVREEQRIWEAWKRWVHSRRAKRQREADMRRLRTERLQVEGVRQWVMVGLEWIQQKEEMEIEVRRAQQKREHDLSLQQQVQRGSVARWVRRIAEHWRHRTAKKEEARQPLITHRQLMRWREAQRKKELPRQLDRLHQVAAEDIDQLHNREQTEAVLSASSVQPAVPFDHHYATPTVQSTGVSRRTRVRAEPRRHVELLLDEPVVSVPPVLDVSQLSTSIPSHQQQRSERPPSPQPQPPVQPSVWPEVSGPVVDDALLAALSAPSLPLLDLTAIESRLHFLAGLRSAYIHNKQELERLQAASSSTSLGSQSVRGESAVGDESHAARCAVLLHACLDFEQQRLEWKREVQQWQTTLRRAQLSSG